MTATYGDLNGDGRHDIQVEFIARRPITCDGDRLHRLLVADRSGERFSVLIAPETYPLYDLKTGEEYRIQGLHGCDPTKATRDPAGCCSNCGEPVRSGRPVYSIDPAILRAAAALDIEEPFGVIDAQTTITTGQETTDRIDDWRPVRSDQHDRIPDRVCDSCGSTVHERSRKSPRQDHRTPRNHSTDRGTVEQASINADHRSNATIGLTTGGAGDASNFRRNIDNGYTPRPAAITDEGLFAEYHFETGDPTETDAMFAPRFSTAVDTHPLTDDVERYLAVGLDSTLPVDAFERPRLELVVVLDVSGSMNGSFDDYYYDRHGRRHANDDDATTKLEAAKRALCALTEQLRDSDRLGVVVFNQDAHVAKPLRDVGATDVAAIQRHVDEVAAGGGTNLAAGFTTATELLGEGMPDSSVEHRVVIATDMMPNTGTTAADGLTELVEDAAVDGIHTTFLGVGLDENADLADRLSGIRGANHHFVHSATEFERSLGESFEYMVTPLVYDLGLELEADGYEVAAVHGSPTADDETGRLIHVGTLFPAPKHEGATKGGIVLVRLEKVASDATLELLASWSERDGTQHVERTRVDVPDEPGTYTDDGVRKAAALSRYARTLREWTGDVHEGTGPDRSRRRGPIERSEHERGSVPLCVPMRWANRFEQLEQYLTREAAAIEDDALQREGDLLTTLQRESDATVEANGK